MNPVMNPLSVRINRGENEGVLAGMPVVTSEGVVGHVIRVTAGYSDVMLLTDRNSKIGVRVQGKRSQATAAGAGDQPLRLEDAKRLDDFADGDELVTSGTDALFPPGLKVGKIREARAEELRALPVRGDCSRGRHHPARGGPRAHHPGLVRRRVRRGAPAMKFSLTVLLALALLTLESVVVRYLGFAITRIDVTVAIVAFLALRASTLEGAVSAYGVGYLLDMMSGQPTGLYTFLAVFTFLLGRLAASLVDVRTRVGFALFVLGADIGHALLAIFFSWLTSKSGGVVGSGFSALPLQVFLTALAGALLYPLLHRIDSGEDRAQPGLLR